MAANRKQVLVDEDTAGIRLPTFEQSVETFSSKLYFKFAEIVFPHDRYSNRGNF